MKQWIAALILGLFVFSGCSVMESVADRVISDNLASSSESGQDSSSDSPSDSEGSSRSSGDRSGKYQGMPPQMIPMLFPALYAAYFYWGGVYMADSLKPGEWAKYEFVSREGKKEEKAFLTKAFLSREGKNGGWYYFKIGDQENSWMSFTFKVEEGQKVTRITLKNSQGQVQEAAITDPIALLNPAIEQTSGAPSLKNLPREKVSVPAGKLDCYKWAVSSKDAEGNSVQVEIFLAPSVPGYLAKYQVSHQSEEGRGIGSMTLTAYGKNAAKELKD